MKRQIVQTTSFERDILDLIAKRKLLKDDFEEFKKILSENPEEGDVIAGTGGVRKTRLKSATKGKSGGFRVCYLNVDDKLIIILMFVYQKNEKEDLTPAEKKEFKTMVEAIKKKVRNE